MKRLVMLLCHTLSTVVFGTSLTAAEIIWTNLAGGSWSTAGNWSPNQVPGSADTAVITNAGTYTVILDSSTTIGAFRLGATAGNQTLLINGTSLVVNGASAANSNGFISLFSGTLGGAGDISVEGLLNLFGGSLAGTGILSIRSSGQMQVNGNVDLAGRTIANEGRLVWTMGNLLNGRAFTNLPSGIFDILLSSSNNFSCTQTGLNAGLIRQMGGDGNLKLPLNSSGVIQVERGILALGGYTSKNLPVNNSGTIQVESGMLTLSGGGRHTGNINVSSNATIHIGANGWLSTFDFEPASTTTGDGSVVLGTHFGWETNNLRGIFELKGTTTVGGIANFFSGYSLSNSPLVLRGRANFDTGKVLSPSRLNNRTAHPFIWNRFI